MNRLVVALILGALSFPPVALAQAPATFSIIKCRDTDVRTVLAFAENGDADAMLCMALKYANGKHVPHDDAQATRWYIKGAEAGQPRSMFFAGVAFWAGRGVTQDMVEGYKWLDLSIKLSGGKDHGALTAQEGLTRVLSAQQITEAKKRASDWEKAFQARKK